MVRVGNTIGEGSVKYDTGVKSTTTMNYERRTTTTTFNEQARPPLSSAVTTRFDTDDKGVNDNNGDNNGRSNDSDYNDDDFNEDGSDDNVDDNACPTLLTHHYIPDRPLAPFSENFEEEDVPCGKAIPVSPKRPAPKCVEVAAV